MISSIVVICYCNKTGWMACHLSNRKKRVSCNWIRGINFSLIEGEQPNFYAEKYPFFLQQSSSSPSAQFVLSCVTSTFSPQHLSLIHSGRIFKSAYQNTSGSIVQCSNLHARQRVGSCDAKHYSRSEGCKFHLPNRRFLYPWSHFTR